MELYVRLAVPADTDILVDFNRAMAMETEEIKLQPEVVLAGVSMVLDNPHLGFYVVAEHSEAIVGALMITSEWSDWRNKKFWWIQSVYVLPEFRRRGIYKRLYEFVKAKASREGDVCGFRLYVERNNVIAKKTYQSLGMQEAPYQMYEQDIE